MSSAIDNVLLTLVIALMIIHTVVLYAPATVGDLTDLNTTALEDETGYSTGAAEANATTGPKVVEQAGEVLDYLTGNSFQNFWLLALNFITFIAVIMWIVARVWIG